MKQALPQVFKEEGPTAYIAGSGSHGLWASLLLIKHPALRCNPRSVFTCL
jgi:hypothetical protein